MSVRKSLLVLMLLPMLALAGVRVQNSSSVDLGAVDTIRCGTDMTCTKSGRKLLMSVSGPSLTLDNAEVISNAVDDVVDVASNDADIVFSLTSPLTSNGDATLRLVADASADNGDDWQIQHDGGTNSLLFQNDTGGSQATKLTLASTGIMTMTAALTLADAETISNGTDDIVRLASNDTDMIAEIYSPLTTNGDSTVQLTADAGADNGDKWQLQHDGGTNNLIFLNNTSGSQVAKWTMTTAGNLTLVGTVTGDGGDAMSGFLQKQVAATATTITAAQCGSSFVNSGAVLMALPEASTVLGCRLTFIVGNASNFDVNPDDADIILPFSSITPSAGDAVRSATLGVSATLEAISASQWAVIAINGAFTDIN